MTSKLPKEDQHRLRFEELRFQAKKAHLSIVIIV